MRKIILIILMMLLFGVCSVQAVDITFSTSGTISNGDVYDNVYVENDFTVVDMSGGQIGNLQTSHISTFNMSGGQITGQRIDVGISGTINISNGVTDISDFVLREDSYTLILGGNVTANRMKVYYDCLIDIKGGMLQINGYDEVGFAELPTINIYGYDFNYDPYGGTYEGLLTGYLSDGNPFVINDLTEVEFEHFNLIPEPTTLLLFGLGGLFLRRRS